MYIPPQCQGGYTCATLLTSFPNMTDFAMGHIDELRLFVKVAFLGNNLNNTVTRLYKEYKNRPDKSVLILHYTPSDLILHKRDYINVFFKNCEYFNNTKSLGCRYELNRLIKVAYHKIDTVGLAQAVRKFKFDDDSYEHLIHLYEKNRDKVDLKSIACQWMIERESVW